MVIDNILDTTANAIANAIANSTGIGSADLIKSGFILLELILSISVYSVFIWYFYRFIAKRDILKLDLNKYNQFKFGFLLKFFAVIFYIIEFIVIIPLLVIFWFAIFSLLLLLLAKEQPPSSIVLIAISVVGAIRLTSYFNEDLSKDLAKMIPFTLLAIAIITPGFFDFSLTMQKIYEVPLLLNNILIYGVFIIILESLLRLGNLVHSLISPSEEISEYKKKQIEK